MHAWLRAVALGLALGGALVAPGPAAADVFGPISLVSEGSIEGGGEIQQAEYAHDPAISGDGRYIAFDGAIGGVTGVWRRDLVTGQIQQVAGGDAELPSISQDGRYISFTTNEGASLPAITDGLPDERPQPEAVNVYVRDMDVPAAAPCSPTAVAPLEECAFTVASAPNGSTAPLTYTATSPSAATTTGSAAIGRSAISADGHELAFVTTAVSDLTDPQTPSEPKTPAFQVAVRYLDEALTKLVSGRYEPATGQTTEVPMPETAGKYGAVYPGNGVGFAAPPSYGAYGSSPPPGASLSADGSTVAWMGAEIGVQAPLLASEVERATYTEPLWRRIAPGSETPTERVTGGSDPLSPACVASGETQLPIQASSSDPCQGPFVVAEGQPAAGILAGGSKTGFVPRLSADGYTVAFVSQAPLVALGSNFGRGKSGQSSDLYVANMRPGRTRGQALTPLTELAGGEAGGLADTAAITDFGISPDGTQVAFTTKRTQFPLGFPAYVTPPAAEPGMNELFDADLSDGTLTRVTQGYEGGPGEHPHILRPTGQDPYEEDDDGGLAPSFSADGQRLAFSSTAANLVWGDGNTPALEPAGTPGRSDGADAFVLERRTFGSLPAPSYISPAPAGPLLTPAASLSATAVSRPDGSVLLYVEVPGRGALRAAAHSAIPVRAGFAARSRAARGGHGASTRHGLSHPAARRRGHPLETVADRDVASATVPTRTAEMLTVVLRLATPYGALASQAGGLSATVRLIFIGVAGRPVLRQSVAVAFRRTASAARRASRGTHKGRRR
jgi:hypothetical protein